jgi:hypothetical protein
MALVSEVRAMPKSLKEVKAKTASAPPAEEAAHDACGGVDAEGRPWPAPYYLHDGLRRVRPYHFTYNTWVKGRWRGRGILDVFASEFRDRTYDYYVRSTFCVRRRETKQGRKKLSRPATSASTGPPLAQTPFCATATSSSTRSTATSRP